MKKLSVPPLLAVLLTGLLGFGMPLVSRADACSDIQDNVAGLASLFQSGSLHPTFLTGKSFIQDTPSGNVVSPLSSSYYVDDATAQAIASALGDSVTQQNPRPDVIVAAGTPPVPLANFIHLQSGKDENAAFLAYYANVSQGGAGDTYENVIYNELSGGVCTAPGTPGNHNGAGNGPMLPGGGVWTDAVYLPSITSLSRTTITPGQDVTISGHNIYSCDPETMQGVQIDNASGGYGIGLFNSSGVQVLVKDYFYSTSASTQWDVGAIYALSGCWDTSQNGTIAFTMPTVPAGNYTLKVRAMFGSTTGVSNGVPITVQQGDGTWGITPANITYTNSEGGSITNADQQWNPPLTLPQYNQLPWSLKVGDTVSISITNTTPNTPVYMKGQTQDFGLSSLPFYNVGLPATVGTTDANGNFTYTTPGIVSGAPGGNFAFYVGNRPIGNQGHPELYFCVYSAGSNNGCAAPTPPAQQALSSVVGYNPATGASTPGTAVYGTTVDLNGTFQLPNSFNTIGAFFDGQTFVRPSSYTASQLVVPLGALATGTHSVVVSQSGNYTNALTFTVTSGTATSTGSGNGNGNGTGTNTGTGTGSNREGTIPVGPGTPGITTNGGVVGGLGNQISSFQSMFGITSSTLTAPAVTSGAPTTSVAPTGSTGGSDLEAEVQALQAEVARLEAELQALQATSLVGTVDSSNIVPQGAFPAGTSVSTDTISGSNCTIAVGQTTCQTDITWSTQDVSAVYIYERSTGEHFNSVMASGTQSVTVDANGTWVDLYHGVTGMLLSSVFVQGVSSAPTSLSVSFNPNSPAAQNVVGGTTDQPIAAYNMTSSIASTIQEMDFQVIGTTQSPVTNLRLGSGGPKVPVVNGVADFTGLSIVVPPTLNGVGEVMLADYANNGPATTGFALKLTQVKYTASGIAQSIAPNAVSNQMTLVGNGTAPIFTLPAIGQQAVGMPLSFSFNATDAQAGTLSATTNWGDASSADTNVLSSQANVPTAFNLSHTYAQAGSYTVTVTVSFDGSSLATSHTVSVPVIAGSVSVAPASLSFSFPQGGAAPAAQTVAVSNLPLNTVLTIAQTANTPLLNFGTISYSGASAKFTVLPNSAALALSSGAHSYAFSINGTFTGSPITVPVVLSVGQTNGCGYAGGGSVSGTTFPKTIRVTVTTLNVRCAPSTSAPFAGSQTLSLGNTFTAVDEVIGDSVGGNNLWWKSSLGNYVWSGGTAIVAGVGGGPIGRVGRSSTVRPVSDGSGTSYNVTYSYLPDGEASASVTYRGQALVVQAGSVCLVASDGSVSCPLPSVLTQDYGQQFWNVFLANLESAMTNIDLTPGLIFSTPPNAPSGTYETKSGQFQLSIVNDASGNVLSAQSVFTSGYGSGIQWYNLGNGYFAYRSGAVGGDYFIGGGNLSSGTSSIPVGTSVRLPSVRVMSDAGGDPTSMTATVAIGSMTGANETLPTSPITLAVTAAVTSQPISASALHLVSLPSSTASLVTGLVLYQGALFDVVNAGGVAAYQYVTANNLTGASVIKLANGGYQVAPANAPAVAFDATGRQINPGSATTTISLANVLSQLKAATSFDDALAIAQEAGLAVQPQSGDGYQGMLILNPGTGETLASVEQWTDTFDLSTTTVSQTTFSSGHLSLTASGISTPSMIAALKNIIATAAAAGTIATAVGNNTGQMASCDVAGTNGAAVLNVFPNGQIYGGGVSAYAFNYQCNVTQGCTGSVGGGQAVAASVESFINGLGISQLENSPGSNGQISLIVQNSVTPMTVGMAVAISTVNPDRTFSNSCNANIGLSNLIGSWLGAPEIAGTSPADALSNYMKNVAIHEVLHCMGLGHTDNSADMMSTETPDSWFTGTPSLDPAEVATLRQIANGQVLQVENCSSVCSLGRGYIAAANGSELECRNISDLCSDPSQLWDEQTQSCQTCQQLGYPEGWTADQNAGVCELQISGGGVEPLPVVPEHICLTGQQWDDTTSQCVQSASVVSNICFTSQDGTVQCTCDTGYVQRGSSCVAGGYACSQDGSCVFDQNGGPYNDAACSAACVASGGGYECSGDSCVYNPNGGSYSDDTCNDACGMTQ